MVQKKEENVDPILKVDIKSLNADVEMRRMFGSRVVSLDLSFSAETLGQRWRATKKDSWKKESISNTQRQLAAYHQGWHFDGILRQGRGRPLSLQIHAFTDIPRSPLSFPRLSEYPRPPEYHHLASCLPLPSRFLDPNEWSLQTHRQRCTSRRYNRTSPTSIREIISCPLQPLIRHYTSSLPRHWKPRFLSHCIPSFEFHFEERLLEDFFWIVKDGLVVGCREGSDGHVVTRWLFCAQGTWRYRVVDTCEWWVEE